MGLIRLILSISIIVFHTGQTFFGAKLNGGPLSVQLFFIISGFYMTLIINNKYNNSYYLFLTNRFLRLYPLYLFVIIISIFIFSIDLFFFDYHKNWLGNLINNHNKLNIFSSIYIILSNLLIIGQDIAFFSKINLATGSLVITTNFNLHYPQVNSFMVLGQAWTIGLEITFYLIAPIMLTKQIKYILLYILASIILRLFIYYVFHLKHDPWTYRFIFTEILYFLLGSLSYKTYITLLKLKLKDTVLMPLTIFLWISVILYGNLFANLNEVHIYQTILHLAYVTLFTLLLPYAFMLTKESELDKFIGDLSYPIYLSHSIFIYLGNRFQINSVYFIVFCSVVASITLNYFIAKPIESFRQKRIRHLTV